MIIIIFGHPGAGKGTQAEILKKDFNLHKISTGDLLRDEIKKKSSIGIEIETLLKKGKLVSDNLINDLIEVILSNKKYFNRLNFDGYPRNLNQAKYFDSLITKHKQVLTCVLSLKVSKNVVIKRIVGRQVCSNCGLTFNKFFNKATTTNHNCDEKFLQIRSDDSEKTAINRLKTYDKETLPLLGFYKKQKLLYEIDGTSDINVIYKEIKGVIDSLETWLCVMYLYK